MMTDKRARRVTLSVILLAVVVRFAGLRFGLPYIYQVDEARWVDLVKGVFRGDLNPHFFFLPNLYMYLVAAAWRVVYAGGHLLGAFPSTRAFLGLLNSDPSLLYMIGRVVTAAMSVVAVWLVYLVGKRMYNRRVGWLAALFLVFSLEHAKAAKYFYPDAPMMPFLMAALLFVWAVYKEGKPRDYLLAGAFAGLAFATKYGGHIIAVPLLLAHLFRTVERKRPLREIVLSWPLVGSGLAFVLSYLAVCPYALLDFATFRKHFGWQSSHLNAIRHYGTPPSVTVPMFYLQHGFRDNLGLLVQFLALGGLVLAAVKGRRREWILVSAPVALLVLMSTWKTYATRYMTTPALFLVVVAAYFADWLLARKPFGTPERAGWAGAALVAVCLAPSVAATVKFDVNLIRPDTRTVALRWVDDFIPPKTKIALEEYGPPLSPHRYDLLYEMPSLSRVSVDWLADHRVRYAVVSDIISGRFVPWPRDFPLEAGFYRSLDERAALVKRFDPLWDEPLIDLHNPTLKVYRLDVCRVPEFPGNFGRYAQSVALERRAGDAWTLRSALRAEAPVAGERVFSPYVRLVTGDDRDVARLTLADGEFPGPGAGAAAASAPVDLPAGRYRAILGYEWEFSTPGPGGLLSGRFRKETGIGLVTVLPGVDRAETVYSFAQFPGTRGDTYGQSVVLVRRGHGWRLSSALFGGELRVGDDYVQGPFVEVDDGPSTRKLTLAAGRLGSMKGLPRGDVRRSVDIAAFRGTPRLDVGYDAYLDKERANLAGGPLKIELLLPDDTLSRPAPGAAVVPAGDKVRQK